MVRILRTVYIRLNNTSMNNKAHKILSVLIFTVLMGTTKAQTSNNCLFKNPLCFYNTDILSYLQILHKNQQYEKMLPFFHGNYAKSRGLKSLRSDLENGGFGYSMKRAGIKETEKNKWSMTYQRVILGTNETFKINCILINDTCRIDLDEKTFSAIFGR